MSYNLNKNLISHDSLAGKIVYVGGYDFDSTTEVQSKGGKFSTINSPSLVKVSGGGNLTGTIQNQAWLDTTWSLRTTPSKMITAEWYYSIYEGTSVVGSLEFYPIVASGILQNDYHVWNVGRKSDLNTAGTARDKTYNNVHIFNNTGTVQTFYMEVRTKYIVNESGRSSV